VLNPASIARRLPSPVAEGLKRARGWWRWARVDRSVTRVLGPRYQRSRHRIELDITWACNLRCFNCNRSCAQAPTGEGMTLAQVERFVEESLATGTRWSRIRVLGGEPTLHPQFHDILQALLRYRAVLPDTVIEVATNGHGPKVAAALARIPPGVKVENTAKTSVEQPFESFNVAPVDVPLYQRADYRNGCVVTEVCGIGLGPHGYYACAVAAGIDRIHGLGLGRPSLPAPDDTMEDQLDAFCRRCGSFKRHHEEPVTGPVSSPSWDAAYDAHRRSPPSLPTYGA